MADETDAQVRRRVGAAIKLRREQLQITQDDLAARASVSARAVSGAETGERLPRGTTRRAYENALGWTDGSIDLVIEGRDPVARPPDVTQEMHGASQPGSATWPVGLGLDDAAADLDPADVDRIRAYIQGLKDARDR